MGREPPFLDLRQWTWTHPFPTIKWWGLVGVSPLCRQVRERRQPGNGPTTKRHLWPHADYFPSTSRLLVWVLLIPDFGPTKIPDHLPSWSAFGLLGTFPATTRLRSIDNSLTRYNSYYVCSLLFHHKWWSAAE